MLNKEFPIVQERLTAITELINYAHKKKEYHKLEIDGSIHDLPKIQLSEHFLLYRVNNARISSLLMDKIKEHNLEKDFFIKNGKPRQDDQQVNMIIHEILCEIIKNDSDDNRKVWEEEFEKFGPKETEPLVITPEGVLINGNLRTCFLRENRNFLKNDLIPCVVIDDPNISQSESKLDRFEYEVDNKKDMKVKHTWYNQWHKLYNKNKLGMSPQEIAKDFGQKTPKQIETIQAQINAIDLIEERFKLIGKEPVYSEENDKEQAYIDISKALIQMEKDNSSPQDIDSMKFLLLNLLTFKDDYDGRIYGPIRTFSTNVDLARKHVEEFYKDYMEEKTQILPTGKEKTTKQIDKKALAKRIQSDLEKEPEDRLVTHSFITAEQEKIKKIARDAKKELFVYIEKISNLSGLIKMALNSGKDYDTDGLEVKINSILETLEDTKDYISKKKN